MTTMIAEVYDALVSAGADDGKARRAAEVLTNFDDRFASVERRFDQLDRRIDQLDRRIDQVDGRIATMDAKFDGRFNLLYWMFGIIVASNVALVIHSFVHL